MQPRFSLRDLLIFTAVLAVHFALIPLAVTNADATWTTFIIVIPTLIAIWVHLRLRLDLLVATGSHYLVSLVWSFLYGLGYCIALNAHNAANPTHGRTFAAIPWALDDMLGMAVFGIITSTLYLTVGYIVVGMVNRWACMIDTIHHGSNVG